MTCDNGTTAIFITTREAPGTNHPEISGDRECFERRRCKDTVFLLPESLKV
ncbi:MAG: hypothetical protein J5825_11920 [Lachnospiraceae bacterium]|nr:hypothetical protein [Lachnospiraceae bacterium]